MLHIIRLGLPVGPRLGVAIPINGWIIINWMDVADMSWKIYNNSMIISVRKFGFL